MEQEQKKPNPYNSDTLQAFLDARAAIERMNLGLTDINDIIADLQKEKSELREIADQIHHSHKYPDRKIGFSQSARYDDKVLFYELPRAEQILFTLMCDIQDPQSGYVTVIKHMFVEVLHFTDTERKNLQRYLDDLTERGFLFCHYRATNKKPGEYQINQAISWIGKRKKSELSSLQKFKSKYTIGRATIILQDGTKTTSGTLQLIDLENIKNGASAGHTDSHAESSNDSGAQTHFTESEPENQDSDKNTGDL